MIELSRVIWCALIGLFRSRASLEIEILALRHQFNILRRKPLGAQPMSTLGHSRPSHSVPISNNVRFSNRPFEVKHFQAIPHCSVDVAHGLALLFGLGT
jgi:hypothetical protein